MTDKIIIAVVAIIAIFAILVLSSQVNFKNISITDYVQAFMVILLVGVTTVYTIETQKIANLQSESNLRPVILREGTIVNWNVPSLEEIMSNSESEPQPLAFVNHNNIATDISGYVILQNKKHQLYFANDASDRSLDSKDSKVLSPRWAWLQPNHKVFAYYFAEKYSEVEHENEIYVSFHDIEGNEYIFLENSEFQQTSKKKK